ncbi:MAG TPA: hypothetical protein VNA18_07850 [Nitrososphaeraceae archaeon]|nr:hypothetical protein [Nitrososphaeraceae archaeon]
MGEPYCNDPRCQRNRSGERHKVHVVGEEQANTYLGENYCNDPRCQRNRNGQKHEAHTESIISNVTVVDKRFDTTDEYTYCNDSRCQINRDGERHRPHSPDNPNFYYIRYLGGHKAFPTYTDTKMHFYYDRVEIDIPKLVVPYRHMQNIENTNEKKISALRVIVLGLIFVPLAIVGALWKKNHIYTIIRFRDYFDDQMIVLDFDKNIDSAQSVIYKRMLEFRNSKKF